MPYFGRLYDCINEKQGVEDPTGGFRKAQKAGSGPNSREGKKLQGVSSVHGVQCHTQLKDARDLALTEKERTSLGATYWARANIDRKTGIFSEVVEKSPG